MDHQDVVGGPDRGGSAPGHYVCDCGHLSRHPPTTEAQKVLRGRGKEESTYRTATELSRWQPGTLLATVKVPITAPP